jgi:hypothetical protein
MPFKDPMPMEVLRYLAKTRRADPDVRALLWEISRLHSLLSRQHQLARSSMPWTGVMATLWDEHKEALCKEPCLIERAAWAAALTDPDDMKEPSKVAPQKDGDRPISRQ